ncbi:MAG: hypothetical protein QG617_949 [Campylobacterota bacterium]|nr:hypothetical protein [Campylobacterota bacterium]
MEMTKEQEEQARKQFEENIKNVDESDVEYASKKGQSKINKIGDNPPNALLKLWEDVKLMVGLITDYLRGNYKEVPWNVIASIAAAIVYFVSPVDIIPDFIPALGYADDAAVLRLALSFAGPDLEKYKQWKDSK